MSTTTTTSAPFGCFPFLGVLDKYFGTCRKHIYVLWFNIIEKYNIKRYWKYYKYIKNIILECVFGTPKIIASQNSKMEATKTGWSTKQHEDSGPLPMIMSSVKMWYYFHYVFLVLGSWLIYLLACVSFCTYDVFPWK